ncbi:MAG: hypothetical protein ACK466_07630, partial [Pseudanabaena sp.]
SRTAISMPSSVFNCSASFASAFRYKISAISLVQASSLFFLLVSFAWIGYLFSILPLISLKYLYSAPN